MGKKAGQNEATLAAYFIRPVLGTPTHNFGTGRLFSNDWVSATGGRYLQT